MSFSITISIAPKLISAIHKFERTWDAASRSKPPATQGANGDELAELQRRFEKLEKVARVIEKYRDSEPDASSRIGSSNDAGESSTLTGQQILQHAGITMPPQAGPPEDPVLNLLH